MSRNALLLLLPLTAAFVGGWAVITVEDPPEYAVVGRPVSLTYIVRQHGVTKLSGLRGRVEAHSGDATAEAAASAGRGAGQYVATLTLPRAGDWIITIHSGFMKSQVTLLPLRAIPEGETPPALAQRERGGQLFVAKGCVTCHVHSAVAGSGTVAVGPAEPGQQRPAEYLKRFLADPSIGPRSGSGQMPNLDLKPQEIAALTTFLSQGHSPTVP